MLRSFIGSDRGRQVALAAWPADRLDVLAPDHLVWRVLAQVDELDLSEFRAAYRQDGVGRPAYDPAMILALIFYCYSKFRRGCSLRELHQACQDDLGARAIMGGRVPGIGRLSEFQGRHESAIRRLFPQTLTMGERLGLVRLDLVAGDGTKVAANAAMTATVDETAVRAQISGLEAEVAAATTAWLAQTAAEAAAADRAGSVFGATGLDPVLRLGLDEDLPQQPDGGSDQTIGVGQAITWRGLLGLQRKLAARREALTWMEEHPPHTPSQQWRERLAGDQQRVVAAAERVERLRARLQAAWDQRMAAQAAGRVFLGPPMTPVERHSQLRREQESLERAVARAARTATQQPRATRVNTTDPTSRIMPAKRGGFDQMFNVQALACAGQFILAITVHDNPSDAQALKPLLRAARANLDAAGIARAIRTALFDAGYACQENITDPDLPVDQLLIAVEKEARQAGRCTDGISTSPAAWQSMADTLADPTNAALYKRRGATIEPLFAQLFQAFGRDLDTRGQAAVTELHLWAITHNLGKIARARARQRRPAA